MERMTEKQIERLKKKINQIKKELSADKKFWGGYYHDGRGLRYLQPEYYIKLKDYSGAKRYFNWFNKNFPDDICSPYFLFQWAFVLFETGNLKQAETKILEVHKSDPDIIQVFLEINKPPSHLEYFKYRLTQPEFKIFGYWLKDFIKSVKFKSPD